jgi:hypothetical protein
MAAPGPRGAVATVQFEMLRQGTQECEAALAIREGLASLYPRTVKVYDVVNLTLHGAVLQAGNRRNGRRPKISPRDLELKLLYHEGRLQADLIPSAPTYNHGTHAGTVKALPAGGGERFAVEVQLGDDPWVLGGPGRWVLKVKRHGHVVTGSFGGTFKGTETTGRVTGAFTPRGHPVPTGTAPVENGLTRRAARVIADLSRRYSGSSRVRDLPRLVNRLYATATEVDEAVKRAEPAAP